MTNPTERPPTPGSDLGFGSRVGRDVGSRLLNRDGSFNVVRDGLPLWRQFNPYHALTSMTWPRFYALVLVFFLATNLAFSGLYLLCGPQALAGSTGSSDGRFWDAFFFSVQTLATIGYGQIHPVGLPANLLVSAEALVGMLGFSLATGLTFARFALPSARIRFSRQAAIAPYRGGRALMFRIVNERSSQLVEVQVSLTFSWLTGSGERRIRRYVRLPLERDSVTFFPLHWVVVHPIDEGSPLWGCDAADLAAADAELLILARGHDEGSSQSVHVRSSYKADEIAVGAKFTDIFLPVSAGGPIRVDVGRFDELEPSELPPPDRAPERGF